MRAGQRYPHVCCSRSSVNCRRRVRPCLRDIEVVRITGEHARDQTVERWMPRQKEQASEACRPGSRNHDPGRFTKPERSGTAKLIRVMRSVVQMP